MSRVSSENVFKRGRLTQRRDYGRDHAQRMQRRLSTPPFSASLPRSQQQTQGTLSLPNGSSSTTETFVWFELDVLHDPAVAVRSTQIHLDVCGCGASPGFKLQTAAEFGQRVETDRIGPAPPLSAAAMSQLTITQ